VDAHYRLGAVLAETGQHVEAVKVWERVLDRDDLEPDDRIEALARLGYSLVELKDYAGAEEVLRSALVHYKEESARKPFASTYYVAMCQYYLAEIPRWQFAAIPLRMPAEQLDRDIEQKAELVLLARDRYIKVVDYKDPYWATAAVYQIGAMHKEFWDDFMAVPIPPELNELERKAYIQAVNEEPQLRKLLEKSLMYHERTWPSRSTSRPSGPTPPRRRLWTSTASSPAREKGSGSSRVR
jgi:tetratricopeptide (TPR) repeat protein